MTNLIYEGLFITTTRGSLARDIPNKHLTTGFRPAVEHRHLYGRRATFKVVGYGNDERNEGYLVKLLECQDTELRALIETVTVPHITLSVGTDGKPVDTARLEFTPVDNGDVLEGVFGGFMNGGELDLGS